MIVGIDLGTTHSLIGIYTEGEPKLFLNPLNKLLTPSVVSLLKDGSIVVGEAAKERLSTHPHLTASVFKRYMGTSRKTKLGKKEFLPEELSSMVLRALIDDAENATGEKVTEAVISVPAYFSDAQRRATKISGELAGIKVERLINEPTAAALAYGLQDRGDKGSFLMVDLGGGTFDISILEIFDGIVEVHATAGDNFLGGEDFTLVLVNAFCKEHGIKKDGLTFQEETLLTNQLEKLKQTLSKSSTAELIVSLSGKEYQWTVTEEAFFKYCEPLVQRMRAPMERAVRDAKLAVADIDEIILVGGASRMSLVGKLVALMFKRFPLRHIDPDQTVAIGAVIASALKARNSSLEEVILTDVCPYTLGVEIAKKNHQTGSHIAGFFMPIITRNSTIPISRVETMGPIDKEQKLLHINVFQGESATIENNINLGDLTVNLPPKGEENRNVDVRFTYDINGILQVEVTVKATGETKEVFLRSNANTLSDDEVRRRFRELSALKIHPRDQQENIILISRAERIYQEYLDYRDFVQEGLMNFQQALNTQDEHQIKEAKERFAKSLAQIEGE